jgi:zinc-ribbon domain
MFCPQCGAEIVSDRVRFCTHCRFPVGAMKEFIATEASKDEAEEEKKFYPLRQRDITLGAGLMLIGALKAILASMAFPGSRYSEISGLLFVLGLFFSAVILFSQLSPRQRGLTFGATIIFLGSLFGLVAGMAIGATPGMFFALSLSLVVSLLWTRLAQMFMRIFFDKEVAPEKKVSSHPQPALNLAVASASELQSAQNVSDVEPTTNRIKEAEMAMPFSVTENTTETLKNKQPFTQS